MKRLIFICKVYEMKNFFNRADFKLKPFKATFACLLLLTFTASMTWAQIENWKYKLQSEDVTMNGEGYIRSFNANNWNGYLLLMSPMRTLVIPDTLNGQPVKGIIDGSGNSGIFSNLRIDSLQLPQTMEVIGSYAFQGNRLDSVKFSDLTALTTIGKDAFQGNRLKTVKFSNLPALTTIGSSAFANNSINSLTFSNLPALTTIGSSAFLLNKLGGVNLSNLTALTTIGDRAFLESNVTSVNLSNLPALTTIGSSAFQFNALGGVNLSNLSALTTIGSSAFRNNKVTGVTLSNLTALTTIGSFAFANNGIYGALNLSNLTALTTLDGFAANRIASLNLSNLTALTTIGRAAFLDNPISGRLNLSHLTALTTIGSYAFANNDINSLNLSNLASLKTIGKDAFASNNISSVDLSVLTALTTINGFANNNITSVDLSVLTSLTTIGERAFYRNTGLNSVNLSNLTSLTTIGSSAFLYDGLDSVNFSDLTALKTIGHQAFGYNSLTSLDLSALTSLITLNGFSDNSLTSVNLSNLTALTTIGSQAFESNNLSSLDLSDLTALKIIGYQAFGYNSLDSLDLSVLTSLTTIQASAFLNNSLTSLDLSSLTSLIHIGDNAFFGNSFSNFELPRLINGVVYKWTDNYSSIYYSGSTVSSFGKTFTRHVPNSSYQVTFNVFNNGKALQGANITLGESYGQKITDRNGQIEFSRVYVSDLAVTGGTLYPTYLNYTITREGRTVKTGQITVDTTDLTLDIFFSNFYMLQDDDVTIDSTNGYITTFDPTNWNDYLDSALQSDRVFLIPDTLHGQPVKGIIDAIDSASGIFANQQIKSLQLPQTMEVIGDYAFVNNSFDSLDFSSLNVLTKIGGSAFANQRDQNSNNKSLTSFVLPPQLDRVIFEWKSDDISLYSSDIVTDLTKSYTRQVPNFSYRVTFNFSDNKGAIRGAVISLGETYGMGTTDENGQVVFSPVYVSDIAATGGTLYPAIIPYTITLDGEIIKMDNITVDVADLTVDIFLTPFYDTLRFTVVDRANNRGLPNVTVTIGNRTGTTDKNGKIVFYEVYAVSDDRISFEVQGAGYATFMGKVENPDSIMVTKEVDKVFLDRYHTATFRVMDRKGTLIDAAITLNETTLIGGFAVFDSLLTDIYEYSATFEGYVTKTGNITIDNANVQEIIQLTSNLVDTIDTIVTDIAADVVFQLFPNPAQQSITITGAGGYDISFYALTGRLVKHIPQVQGSTQVNISGWATGIYTVRVGDRTKKLIVK